MVEASCKQDAESSSNEDEESEEGEGDGKSSAEGSATGSEGDPSDNEEAASNKETEAEAEKAAKENLAAEPAQVPTVHKKLSALSLSPFFRPTTRQTSPSTLGTGQGVLWQSNLS